MLKRLLMLAVLLCLSLAAHADANPDWTAPFPPHRIAGNLYYVGSKDLAAYLVVTSQGLILINSNLVSSPPMIRRNIEKLGFHFRDVKILLISHAHSDHAAGSAEILKLTHAQYMVMAGDVPVVESGGRKDFAFGNRPDMLYPAAKVDRVLHDGSEVRLGDTVLTAHLTPGHTKGCTTWTMKVTDHGKTYDVVIVGSPNLNPSYKLVGNTQYPQIVSDYEHGFDVLAALHCDIFLGAHGVYFDLTEKYPHVAQRGAEAYVDPKGYHDYVAERHQAFEAELKRQQAQK